MGSGGERGRGRSVGPGPILWGRRGSASRRAAASEPRCRTCRVFPESRGVRARGPRQQRACFPRRNPGGSTPAQRLRGAQRREPTPRPCPEPAVVGAGGGRVPVSGTGNGPAAVGDGRRTGTEPVQHRRGGQLRAGHVAPRVGSRGANRAAPGGTGRHRAPCRRCGHRDRHRHSGLPISGPTERRRPRFGGARPVPEPPSPGSGAGATPEPAPSSGSRCPYWYGGGVGGGGHRLPVPGGTPVGQSRVISAPPHRGPRTRAPGTAERRNERRKRSGTGGGARGAGRGGGGRAAAPGRKESGEGGGVNIEYLLIAVEGRSVITGPSSPGGGRRGRCMQRWCRDPRPRAPSGVRGAAGGGRGGALAYRWP